MTQPRSRLRAPFSPFSGAYHAFPFCCAPFSLLRVVDQLVVLEISGPLQSQRSRIRLCNSARCLRAPLIPVRADHSGSEFCATGTESCEVECIVAAVIM